MNPSRKLMSQLFFLLADTQAARWRSAQQNWDRVRHGYRTRLPTRPRRAPESRPIPCSDRFGIKAVWKRYKTKGNVESASVHRKKRLAPRHGFEPRFTAPKAAVLPLDDRGIGAGILQSQFSILGHAYRLSPHVGCALNLQTKLYEFVSPVRIWRAFEAHLVGTASHIIDARLVLADAVLRVFLNGLPGIRRAGEGVDRDLPEVPFAHQVLEGLRRFLLIVGVFVDGGPQ